MQFYEEVMTTDLIAELEKEVVLSEEVKSRIAGGCWLCVTEDNVSLLLYLYDVNLILVCFAVRRAQTLGCINFLEDQLLTKVWFSVACVKLRSPVVNIEDR